MGFKLASLLGALLVIFVILCFPVDSSASIRVSGPYIVPMSQDVEGKPQIEVFDVVTATVPIETVARSVPVEQLTEESRVRIKKGALARSNSPENEGKSLETDMEGKITGKQGAFIEVELDDGTRYWFWQGKVNSEEGGIFLLSAPQEPRQSEKTTQSPQPVEPEKSENKQDWVEQKYKEHFPRILKLTPREMEQIAQQDGIEVALMLFKERFKLNYDGDYGSLNIKNIEGLDTRGSNKRAIDLFLDEQFDQAVASLPSDLREYVWANTFIGVYPPGETVAGGVTFYGGKEICITTGNGDILFRKDYLTYPRAGLSQDQWWVVMGRDKVVGFVAEGAHTVHGKDAAGKQKSTEVGKATASFFAEQARQAGDNSAADALSRIASVLVS